MKIYFCIDYNEDAPNPEASAELVFRKLGIEAEEPYNRYEDIWEWEVEVDDLDVEKFNTWMQDYREQLYTQDCSHVFEWEVNW